MRAFYLKMVRLMIIGAVLILTMCYFTAYTHAVKYVDLDVYVSSENKASVKEEGEERNGWSKN